VGKDTAPISYASFNGMCWPVPDERCADLSWRLRYVIKELPKKDRLFAADVLAAYEELIKCSDQKREDVVSGIRVYLAT